MIEYVAQIAANKIPKTGENSFHHSPAEGKCPVSIESAIKDRRIKSDANSDATHVSLRKPRFRFTGFLVPSSGLFLSLNV